jgi:hypothetical protein
MVAALLLVVNSIAPLPFGVLQYAWGDFVILAALTKTVLKREGPHRPPLKLCLFDSCHPLPQV